VARLIGNETETRWSTLFQGTQRTDEIDGAMQAAGDAAATLARLPLYLVEGAPQGFSYADLRGVAEATRKLHPAGPALLVVDYLQLIGAVDGEDTRARVGAAAYQCRAIARDLGMAVLLVSSVARANYKRLRLPRVGGDANPRNANKPPKGEDKTDTAAEAELFVERSGLPVGRMRNPDALIGLGKESGEIEYAADGLLVAVRLAANNNTEWVALTVPKVRAGRPGWVPLVFEHGQYSAGDYDDAELILRGKLPQPKPATTATPAYEGF
jgi:replicative DNA helicase